MAWCMCLLVASLVILQQLAFAYIVKPTAIMKGIKNTPILNISLIPRNKLWKESNRKCCAFRPNLELKQTLDPPELFASKGINKLENVNKLYYRSSWISWWVQIVLSVISGVILTFANTVRVDGFKSTYLWASGFAFSAVGVILAFTNAFWTWNVTRLCRRIALKKLSEQKAFASLRKSSRIAVGISLLGMLFSLLGAEQIVGTLAAKILSSSGYSPLLAVGAISATGAAAQQPFQAVDIFLVQANTNSIFSHFAALLCYIVLQTQLPTVLRTTTKSPPPPAAGATDTTAADGDTTGNSDDEN